MSQPDRSDSQPNPMVQHGSPQLVTPSGTPPNAYLNESRLHQLLANFDSGTHSFCREERETPAERRESFSSETRPTPPSSRRPSFLSGLTLSRPVFAPSQSNSGASTPVHSPMAMTQPKDYLHHHHHHPHGLTMTPSTGIDRPPDRHIRANSTPSQPFPPDIKMQRSNTMSKVLVKAGDYGKGKNAQGNPMGRPGEEKRHFDPSKEPKLLGLL